MSPSAEAWVSNLSAAPRLIGFSITTVESAGTSNVFNKNDYVKTALEKIDNYKDLIKLKANLRNKIEASPIFDSDTFARNFEDLLLKIHN